MRATNSGRTDWERDSEEGPCSCEDGKGAGDIVGIYSFTVDMYYWVLAVPLSNIAVETNWDPHTYRIAILTIIVIVIITTVKINS